MEFLLLLLLPPLAGFAAGCLAWSISTDREVRWIATGLILALVLLAWETFFLQLCGLGENRSELYNARCGGGTPDLPLLGAPALVAIGLAAVRWRSPLWWVLGLAVFLAAAVVPWALLANA